MKYTIEIEIPDNETMLEEMKTASVHWQICGYSGDARAKPKEDEEKARLKNMCRVLFNRCRAAGSFDGQMCVFCGMKEECEEMHSI